MMSFSGSLERLTLKYFSICLSSVAFDKLLFFARKEIFARPVPIALPISVNDIFFALLSFAMFPEFQLW